MPVQPFHIVDKLHGKNLQDQVDYLTNELAKTQKILRYLLNGGLDTDNVNELNAKVVNAGILNTNLVTIKAEDGSAYYLIDKNGIVANNGSENTFDFDLATGNLSIKGIITALAGMIGGWTIQDNALYSSTTSYPRVVLDPVNSIILFEFDSQRKVTISSDTQGRPAISISNPNNTGVIDNNDHLRISSTVPSDITISAGGELNLETNSNRIRVSNWNTLYSNVRNETLQTALNDKIDKDDGVTNVFTLIDENGDPIMFTFVNGQLQHVS